MKSHYLVVIFANLTVEQLQAAVPPDTVLLLTTTGKQSGQNPPYTHALALLPQGTWIKPPLELRTVSDDDVPKWSGIARRTRRPPFTCEELGITGDPADSGLPFSPEGELPITSFTIQTMREGTPGFFLPPECTELILSPRYLDVTRGDELTYFVHNCGYAFSYDLRLLPQGLNTLRISGIPRGQVLLPSDVPRTLSVVWKRGGEEYKELPDLEGDSEVVDEEYD